MEQQREKLNINLKANGELNLSGSISDLTQEEYIVLQQVIDESQRRSRTAQRIEAKMREGQITVGICAAIAIILLSFVSCYALTSWLSAQFKSIETRTYYDR